jgi:two-component system chemotaxis response regulator CheB
LQSLNLSPFLTEQPPCAGKVCDLIASEAKPAEANFQSTLFQPNFPRLTISPHTQASVIALAASAGGLHALSMILASLPRNFPAPILVAQHLSPDFPSRMDWLFGRRISLCVKWTADGDCPQAGCVYLGPPGRHLRVCPDGTLSLRPAENVGLGRPSADILFRSLADSADKHAVAVVLTGMCRDAASSRFPSMPGHAVLTGAVDHVRPLTEIGPLLIKLTSISHKPEFESLP